MKFRTEVRSVNLTPFRYRRGLECWWRLRIVLKKDEQAERITLCAWICSLSHARVTSKKSLSSLISRKAELMFVSKSFHRRQNFSVLIVSLLQASPSNLLFSSLKKCYQA